jgi:peptidoglycan/xylan/chitin deacetylase (PgdA/CDA1 family)
MEVETLPARVTAARAKGRLRVLTYHRVAEVAETPWLNPRLISATPELFAAHVRYLARHCRVVSLPEVVEAAEGGKRLPPRAVLVTFDDAYRDFGDVAWPILKRFGLPATLFVPTAYPDHPERAFWWDRLFRCLHETARTELDTACGPLALRTPEERWASLVRVQRHVKSMPHDDAMSFLDELCAALGEGPAPPGPSVLGWDELRRLSREGVTIGAHTRRHPLLTRVSPERAREEVVGSQEDVRREIGEAPPVFSYPNGSHDATTVRILREAGFLLAFSQRAGHNVMGSVEPHRLRRINVTRRNSPGVFRLRLQPWFDPIDRWRQRSG